MAHLASLLFVFIPAAAMDIDYPRPCLLQHGLEPDQHNEGKPGEHHEYGNLRVTHV